MVRLQSQTNEEVARLKVDSCSEEKCTRHKIVQKKFETIGPRTAEPLYNAREIAKRRLSKNTTKKKRKKHEEMAR